VCVCVCVCVCVVSTSQGEHSLVRLVLTEKINQIEIYKCGENSRRKAGELRECTREKGDREIDGLADDLSKLCSMRTNST